MIEIYDKDQILFMAPLSRQDEFYVEETQDDDRANNSTVEEGIGWQIDYEEPI